jgi:hypothetical protein
MKYIPAQRSEAEFKILEILLFSECSASCYEDLQNKSFPEVFACVHALWFKNAVSACVQHLHATLSRAPALLDRLWSQFKDTSCTVESLESAMLSNVLAFLQPVEE